MPKIIAVTGADANYFAIVRDCVESLRSFPELDAIDVAVLDLGLEPAQRSFFDALRVSVVAPGWDLDVSRYQGVPSYFQAMTARPHLPRHFPQHDIIMWFDADSWVQDPSFVRAYWQAAEVDGFAITPEVDRAYSIHYGAHNTLRLFHHNVYAQCFGRAVADQLIHFPILNTGAFAIRREHPIWPLWQQALVKTMNNVLLLHSEQAALNFAAYLTPGISRPHMLPAAANWVCAQALPKWDPQQRKLVEANFPHGTLGLVHLTGIKGDQRVSVLGGGEVTTALTRSAILKLSG